MLGLDGISGHSSGVQVGQASTDDNRTVKKACRRNLVQLRPGGSVEDNPRQLCGAFQGEWEALAAIVFPQTIFEAVQ